MTDISKKFHNIIISILFSVLVWLLVNNYLVKMHLYEFICIEIIIGFSQIFCIFVKEKLGIIIQKPDTENNGFK